MKFEISTLIDITETKAKFDKNNPDWHRQQNFMTIISTLGLRANPTVTKTSVKEVKDVKELGFGSSFKGKHAVWSFEFEFEQEGAHDLDSLKKDFNLVPVINNLSETIKLSESVFNTVDATKCNTIFKCYD